MTPRKTLLSWSSGKDSAWTLQVLREDPRYEVAALLTTVNEVSDRVAMHAVRRSLLEKQAQAAGLPLRVIPLPWPCSNQEYERRMKYAGERAVEKGFEVMAFGDLFLRDIRTYREKQLSGTGLDPVFPLWEMPTDALARQMIHGGLRARLTCVDPKQLDPVFAGREFDLSLLSELPPGVDPCGENGEFHTFAYAGPMFAGISGSRIPIHAGATVERDGFHFADLSFADLP